MWDFALFPEQASDTAARVDELYLFELAICALAAALVCLLIIALAIRYRRGTRVNRDNPPESSKAMELLWIGAPLVIFMGMFAWSTRTFNQLYQPPADATEISVVGLQWMWKLQHPEGRMEINELHIPVGRAVKLKMTSQDVIHSFYVPAFRTKQDVLPGRYTEMWFRPIKPGRYHLFCAEYCGTNHSKMGGWIYAMEPAEYERWLAEGQGSGESMVQQGKLLFTKHHCAGCHGPEASVQAPRLEGIYGRPVPIQQGDDAGGETRFVVADDRYIRDSILLPKQQVVAGYKPIMPSYQGQIPEDDLLKIIAYIKSIAGQEAAR